MTASFLKIKDCNKNVSSKCINSVLLSASGIPDVFLDKASYFEQNNKSLVVRNMINTSVFFHFLAAYATFEDYLAFNTGFECIIKM